MNILFFLTPKADCAHLQDDESVREALQRMARSGYSALPILSRDGQYRGTLTEGDLLWGLTGQCNMDIRAAEQMNIMEIAHRRDNAPVHVTTQIQDLLDKALEQNFVPVTDDRGSFIGIITRKSILQYLKTRLVPEDTAAACSV